MKRGESSTMTLNLQAASATGSWSGRRTIWNSGPRPGSVIPDTAKEKPQIGEVLAVGPGAINDEGTRLPMDVSAGDRVLYSKYAGTEVKLDGQEYLVLSARDVLAIVA